MPNKFIYFHFTAFSASLFSFLSLTAQNKCSCDDAEQLRAPMGFYFNSGRLDSASFFAAKLLDFKEPACNIYYQDWMAQIAIGKKDFPATRTFLETEKRLLKENKCSQDLYVRYYSTLSKLYQELNQLDSFVTACLNGIDASQQANDFYGLSRANADVASAFSEMGQHDKALFYYTKAINAAHLQTKVPTQLSLVQIRLGNEYLSLFEKKAKKIYADSAAMLGKDALDTAKKYHDLLTYLEANQTLADHALLTGENQQAIVYSDEMIQSSPKGVHIFDRLIYGGYSGKSEALYKLNKFQLAEVMADSAFSFAQAYNPQMMIGAYKKIYQAAKANNNTAKSLAAYEKMVELRDSLFSLEKNKTVSELEKKYNQAKNESTIKDLSKKKQQYLFLALAGLLAAAAIAFFLRQQSLKHKKNILETEQRLNRARMNPHFFFNALTTLQKFALRENDGQAMASNLSKFSNIMRETLESTYKEYVTIEQEMEFLNEYLEVQKIRFPKTFTYSVFADGDLEADELLIPSMIIQPFVENSIEHGFTGIDYPGNVSVKFRKENKELLIQLQDNGKGLAVSPGQTSEHISRASQIIKDRIYLLNIKLKTKAGFSIANNENSNGVTVKIHLPLLYKDGKNR